MPVSPKEIAAKVEGAVMIGALCSLPLVMCGAAMGQATFRPIAVPTTSTETLTVLDLTPDGSSMLVEKMLFAQVGPGMGHYSVAHPDGGISGLYQVSQATPGVAINGAGTAVWGSYSYSPWSGPTYLQRITCQPCQTCLTCTSGYSIEAWPTDVTPDERFVIGQSKGPNGTYPGFVWDRSTGFQAITLLTGANGLAFGNPQCLTADGSIIAGSSSSTSYDGPFIPTLWMNSTVGQALPLPAGKNSAVVLGVGSNGIAVGEASVYPTSSTIRAARWPTLSTVELLPNAAGATSSTAQSVSNDGRVIGGYETTAGVDTAVIWIDGARHELKQYLIDNGAAGVSTYSLRRVVRVSTDGRTIAGSGPRSGSDSFVFFATIPALPSGCAADLGGAGGVSNSDGGLDNNDFIAFINLFFAADARADMGVAGGGAGHDGVFDNNDFIAFINAFFAGC